MQLIGEYTVALDEKGRLRVPSALLRQLGEKPDGEGYEFVINRGFEKCMTLYPKPVWDAIAEKLSRLNRFNQTNRAFVRPFYLGAYPVTTDSADRILLQKPSMDYAQISKEAVLVARAICQRRLDGVRQLRQYGRHGYGWWCERGRGYGFHGILSN